jgi:crotonobetainyl-CoA:carnitine CoA-transferase CaiB-like acyl-CoA transferase
VTAGGSTEAGKAALADVVVLDLTRLLPGAFCSLLLADLGADVIKVEEPEVGDYARLYGAAFVALNRNKRSVALDLKDEGGRDAFLRLVERADVVLDSFRPGVAERLGVGYERLRAANPRIVHCALSGWGREGPLAGRAGHDLGYLARVGLLALNGEPDGPPVPPAGQIADLSGSFLAAIGVLAALHERERSGEGQSVDVSLAHGAMAWLTPTVAADERPRRGRLRLHGALACYAVYRCADGWVALAALEPKFWEAFCRGIEREDLLPHAFAGPGTAERQAVADVLAARTRAEWDAFGAEHDCCLEPVLEPEEAVASELGDRLRLELAQPGLPQPATVLGSPLRLSRTPPEPLRRPAPLLGEHTDQVLGNT